MLGPSSISAQKAQKGGETGRGRSSGAPMANDYIPRGDAEFNGWLALDAVARAKLGGREATGAAAVSRAGHLHHVRQREPRWSRAT